MATQLTPLGKFVKWVVAPVVVALVSYVFIGPNFGGSVVQKVRNLPVIGGSVGTEENPAPLEKPSQERAKNFREIRNTTTN